MARNNTMIVAAFALIVSIAAFGFVAHDFFFPPSGVKNTWYKEDLSSLSCPASEEWQYDYWLKITFDVSAGERVFLSYSGIVRLDDSAAYTWVEICFNIDSTVPTARTEPYQRVEGTTTGAGNWWLIPVSLQRSLELAPGTHNVTIQFHGYRILDSVQQSTLMVQTYIP
ncbi:MAG: hypothetical protein Q6373_024130 [Candidatus Sigynarchaeota archaeon]